MNSKKHGLILVDIEYGNEEKSMESGDVAMKMLNVVGYYIFNHRRFSYSAAFTQSYIQRRSAGSWLAGFSYQGGSIETTEDLKERAPNVPLSAYAYKKEEVLSSRIAPLFS